MLQAHGYHCIIANNGQEALDWLEKEEFECVLMDMLMPIMGGLEATEKIREKEKREGKRDKIVIIGVSANAGPKSTNTAMDSGMNGYVTKPYHRAELLETVRKFIGSFLGFSLISDSSDSSLHRFFIGQIIVFHWF